MRTFVEQCQKVNINSIVKGAKSTLVDIEFQSRLEALGQVLNVTTTPCNFGGKRHWFVCPSCKRRVGTLYRLPIQDALFCRKCHNLTYLKAGYHKMVAIA